MPRIPLLSALCLALLAAGCSDAPDDDDATDGTPASPAPEAPDLQIDSSSIDFGQVSIGDADTTIRTLSNAGSADLELTYELTHDGTEPDTFLFSGPSSAEPPSILPPGTTADLMVRFAPTDEVAYSGALTIRSNDEDRPEVVIPLAGTGLLEIIDGDQDGFPLPEDCDDADQATFPGAPEVCDEKDNDCDDQIDEDTIPVWADNDGDGHGDPAAPAAVCEPAEGWSTDELDCDDSDPSIYEGALEACDGKDNDCDGETDEDGLSRFYTDSDGDGHGDPASGIETCQPSGPLVTVGDDCDDADPTVYPDADELCDNRDNDCDLEVDEEVLLTFYADQDSDGYGDDSAPAYACAPPTGHVAAGGDCADGDPARNPSALEACNALDDDCDGQIDEEVQLTFYADADGDGHGDPASPLSACAAPEGYVGSADDCDDGRADSFPGALELCDSADNDCDEQIDEEVQTTYYLDADGDGHGVESGAVQACALPDGFAELADDCNDADPDIYPGAIEACDGKDNDCDRLIDEEGETPFYRDFDKDRHGDPDVSVVGCDAPEGYVASGDDCNDRDVSIYPGATESCNSRDDDCDGQVDEGATTDFYLDADHDTYGDDTPVAACTPPDPRYVTVTGDCDDLDAAAYPGAPERCNSKDDDCDGQIDEGDIKPTWYADDDGDGYGDPHTTTQACSRPTGYVADSSDCNDDSAESHPKGLEVCDQLDNDCDGQVDEGVKTTFYADADADGFGVSGATIQACSVPTGYAAKAGDCNDQDPQVNPAATEACNSVDDDCDGQIDEGGNTTFYLDYDRDDHGDPVVTTKACNAPSGYVGAGDDCNDRNAQVHPDATEICNGIDDDCDNEIDEAVSQTWYVDADRDGYGDPDTALQACSSPGSKYVTRGGDCDDLKAAVNPAATESCNGYDDDCDGQLDESDPAIDFTSDADHCGGCFQACDFDHGTAVCGGGTCQLTGCVTGYYDLDGEADNGCESYAPLSCDNIQALDPAATSGLYTIDPDGPEGATAPFEVRCDMVSQGGGWTLISSVLNDAPRKWNSLSVFTDGSTFGTAAASQTADYKSAAHKTVKARDLLIRTEEYAFGFEAVMSDESFGDFITSRWPGGCNTDWHVSGADFVENLTEDQGKVFGLILRAHDNNASCFPSSNENAAITFTTQSCCWTNGIGNCTSCSSGYQTHDQSVLKKAQIAASKCTAGQYPCNDIGYLNGGSSCYDTSCKVYRVEVWVR